MLAKSPVRRQLLTFSAVCFGAVAFALYSQHGWNMQPCPWCILQRMLFLLAGLIALVAALTSSKPMRVGILLAGISCLGGLGFALYQHFVAAKQQSCSFSQAEKFVIWTGLDEMLPSVFQVTASCADAALAKLMGIPYELASGALFALLAAWAFQLFRAK